MSPSPPGGQSFTRGRAYKKKKKKKGHCFKVFPGLPHLQADSTRQLSTPAQQSQRFKVQVRSHCSATHGLSRLPNSSLSPPDLHVITSEHSQTVFSQHVAAPH